MRSCGKFFQITIYVILCGCIVFYVFLRLHNRSTTLLLRMSATNFTSKPHIPSLYQVPWFERLVSHDKPQEPLLTLFTTFNVSDTFRRQIYKNTITLWPQLGPGVRLIMFVCDKKEEENDLMQMARTLNWRTNTTVCDKNLNIPLFRHMFLAAQQLHNSTFYAYANADMLFDMSLVGSLTVLNTSVLAQVPARRTSMLAFGARTMIDVGQTRNIGSLTELTNITKKEGRFFTVAGIDYFVSTRGDYPWTEFPNFVVSRVAFDSWTVNFFVRKDFPTFDLTDTVVAAHQCDGRPLFRSKYLPRPRYNLNLVDKHFSWRDGMATCSKYKTRMTSSDYEFQIWERTKKGFCGAGTGTVTIQKDYESKMKKEKENLFLAIPML